MWPHLRVCVTEQLQKIVPQTLRVQHAAAPEAHSVWQPTLYLIAADARWVTWPQLRPELLLWLGLGLGLGLGMR